MFNHKSPFQFFQPNAVVLQVDFPKIIGPWSQISLKGVGNSLKHYIVIVHNMNMIWTNIIQKSIYELNTGKHLIF